MTPRLSALCYWLVRLFVLVFPLAGCRALYLPVKTWWQGIELHGRLEPEPAFPSTQWFLLALLIALLGYWAWFVNAGQSKAHARLVLGSQIVAIALGVLAMVIALLVPLNAKWHQELLGSGFGWTVVAALNFFGVRLRLARIDRRPNHVGSSSHSPDVLTTSSGGRLTTR
jgi:hypothetical protein